MLLDLIAALWNASPCAAIIALAPPTLCLLGALFTDRGGPPVRMVRVIGPAVAVGALIATTAAGGLPADVNGVACPSSSHLVGQSFTDGWLAARAHFGFLDQTGRWHRATCSRGPGPQPLDWCSCAPANNDPRRVGAR